MREIILNKSLEINEAGFPEFNPKYFFKDNKDFEPITEISAEITHQNYLYYLSLCWKRHYGAVISPTILWNLILNNLAYKVNQDPEKFRKYFSNSDEKQEIIVDQGGHLIDTNLLINAVSSKIPSDIINHIFPDFSTDTYKSIIANYTAFLDMVSPYYNYSMLLCGIPKIKIIGTQEDWLKFMFNLGAVTATLPECQDYLIKVGNLVGSIIDDTCDYTEMFSLQRCGSGSQVEVSGWIRDFFIEQPKVPYPENFISCIAKIDYHSYNDGNDYRLFAGLFTSKIENGYLIPEFDNMYFKQIKTE